MPVRLLTDEEAAKVFRPFGTRIVVGQKQTPKSEKPSGGQKRPQPGETSKTFEVPKAPSKAKSE